MEEPLHKVADYLTYSEATILYSALIAEDVPSIIKSVGPATFPFGEGLYFRVLVKESDLETAQPIVEHYISEKEKARLEPHRCPRCRSTDVGPCQNVAWYKKLIYAGTTLYCCQNCGEEFFV